MGKVLLTPSDALELPLREIRRFLVAPQQAFRGRFRPKSERGSIRLGMSPSFHNALLHLRLNPASDTILAVLSPVS